jgi:hypothetical protein
VTGKVFTDNVHITVEISYLWLGDIKMHIRSQECEIKRKNVIMREKYPTMMSEDELHCKDREFREKENS